MPKPGENKTNEQELNNQPMQAEEKTEKQKLQEKI